MVPTIHPFPARMAPDLALDTLNELPSSSVILDPMSGSGTVLRQASEMGLQSCGFDLDPLAVLMSRVWNTVVDDRLVEEMAIDVLQKAKALTKTKFSLPWIDDDEETKKFVRFWFGSKQRMQLRQIAWVLDASGKRRFGYEKKAALDVIRIALSRLIITKEQGASLARDTSHSRPHKVAEKSDYEVFPALERSILFIRKKLKENPPWGGVNVSLGDARSLVEVGDQEIDAVITSPPYLNAIDYLRGHRLSLVWLGHTLGSLRKIRSTSIGAERKPDVGSHIEFFLPIQQAMCSVEKLPPRQIAMVQRYCQDLHSMMSEIVRVTRIGGFATLVVGNSCLNGNFIKNSAGVSAAASMLGMKLLGERQRDLPPGSRYLPMPDAGALAGRMRTEAVMTFGRT